MSLAARTRAALGIAPLPRPVYQPAQHYPAPQVTEARTTLPRRHHPLLDRTAIAVRKTHMMLDGLCYCCEARTDGPWLCDDCTTRRCGG